MLMWAATVVENQPKSWLHQEEPAAADNKVIITQALLTAGGGALVHLRHAAMLLFMMSYIHLNTQLKPTAAEMEMRNLHLHS